MIGDGVVTITAIAGDRLGPVIEPNVPASVVRRFKCRRTVADVEFGAGVAGAAFEGVDQDVEAAADVAEFLLVER